MRRFGVNNKLLACLCAAVAFCAIAYVLVAVVALPVGLQAAPYANLLMLDEEPTFEQNKGEVQGIGSANASEKTLFADDVEFPMAGECYAHISCADMGLDAPVYWYDSYELLDEGTCQSLASFPPGFGRAIVISGHNSTDFGALRNAARGNNITFETSYANYTYRVTSTEVLEASALESQLLQKGRKEAEELILYTCWPFEAIAGQKTQRLVVHATRVAGPSVEWRSANGG